VLWHYTEKGSGRPLILLHGIGMSHAAWNAVTSYLCATWYADEVTQNRDVRFSAWTTGSERQPKTREHWWPGVSISDAAERLTGASS
jgi:hypothetical protein